MKPLNQKERSALYWQFLILYIISIAVVVFAVSFYYEVNDLAVQKLKEAKDERANMQKTVTDFTVKLNEIDSMLNILQSGKETTTQQESNIKTALNDLQNIKTEIPSFLDSLYLKVAVRYFNVYDDQVQLKTSGATVDVVKQLNAEMAKIQKELDKCKDDYDRYTTLHP